MDRNSLGIRGECDFIELFVKCANLTRNDVQQFYTTQSNQRIEEMCACIMKIWDLLVTNCDKKSKELQIKINYPNLVSTVTGELLFDDDTRDIADSLKYYEKLKIQNEKEQLEHLGRNNYEYNKMLTRKRNADGKDTKEKRDAEKKIISNYMKKVDNLSEKNNSINEKYNNLLGRIRIRQQELEDEFIQSKFNRMSHQSNKVLEIQRRFEELKREILENKPSLNEDSNEIKKAKQELYRNNDITFLLESDIVQRSIEELRSFIRTCKFEKENFIKALIKLHFYEIFWVSDDLNKQLGEFITSIKNKIVETSGERYEDNQLFELLVKFNTRCKDIENIHQNVLFRSQGTAHQMARKIMSHLNTSDKLYMVEFGNNMRRYKIQSNNYPDYLREIENAFDDFMSSVQFSEDEYKKYIHGLNILVLILM
jgi:hypothetical protein